MAHDQPLNYLICNEYYLQISVVSLRQLERQMGREREKQTEKVQTIEMQYQQSVTHLKVQLQAMEKERNMCMVRDYVMH